MSQKSKALEERLELLSQKIDSLSNMQSIAAPLLSVDNNDEIDLRELLGAIWRGKVLVAVSVFVFGMLSVIYALSLPNVYKSQVLLAPADENSGGGLTAISGQLGGLASLAGVNLASGGNDKTILAMEVLKSRGFITQFIKNRNLLVPLMASRGWDAATNELLIDQDIYDSNDGRWVRKARAPRLGEPSSQEAHAEFMKVFSVSKDKSSGFISLSVEFQSPYIAKEWVDWLVIDINSAIRKRDVAEARTSIQYLTAQLDKTPIADMQKVFYELIEEQSKTIMFAEVRDEYVFETIDEAFVPELKVKPKRSFICIVGLIVGGGLGCLFVCVMYVFRAAKN